MKSIKQLICYVFGHRWMVTLNYLVDKDATFLAGNGRCKRCDGKMYAPYRYFRDTGDVELNEKNAFDVKKLENFKE